MPLYTESEDWEALAKLLVEQAEGLINSGRSNAVRQWMSVLPCKYLKGDPWLCYWYSVAVKPAMPLQAAEQLEACYQKFIDNQDIKGIYYAWQAAVEAITISLDDYSRLKVWMARFDELRKKYPDCPTIDLKIQFYTTAIQALSVYNPQHPWLKGLLRIGENIIRFAPVKKIKIMLSIQLGHYYIFTCQLTKLQVIAHYLEAALYEKTLPAMLRIISAYLLVLQKLYAADTKKAHEYAQKGLELSKLSGIPSFEGILHANLIGCHIYNGDLNSAKRTMEIAKKFANDQQRVLVALNYSYAAWLAALDEDKKQALEQNEQALQLTKLIHAEPGLVCSLALKVQLLGELSQWQDAQQSLSLLSAKAKETNNNFNLIQYYVADAWLAHLKQNKCHALNATENLLQILHAEQIFSFFGWRPDVLGPLCLLAIENNIYSEFAVCLLNKNRLFNKPTPYLEKWPWPVRIYCFGSLTVEIDGNSVEKTGKSQKKILDLLATIIAFGGCNVNNNKLEEVLWPDAEGDLARKSLETALYRLRKLIGKEAVIVNSGLVSLNEKYCWLDLWEFEATVGKLKDHLLENNKQPYLVIKLTNRLLMLYQDTFLKDFNSSQVIMQQKRLLNKLCRLLETVTCFHESRGENERTCELLEKKVELRPLLETSYLQLMQHYIKLGQPDHAVHIFQNCQKIIQEGHGLCLSNKIQSLAKQLL